MSWSDHAVLLSRTRMGARGGGSGREAKADVPGDGRQDDGEPPVGEVGVGALRRHAASGCSALFVARVVVGEARSLGQPVRPAKARTSTVRRSRSVVERLTANRVTAPVSSSWVAVGVEQRDLAVAVGVVRRDRGSTRSTCPGRGGGLGERVEDRLPPGRAAGLGADRRDHVDELRLAGDPDPVGVPQQGDQQAADDDGVHDVVRVLDQRRAWTQSVRRARARSSSPGTRRSTRRTETLSCGAAT